MLLSFAFTMKILFSLIVWGGAALIAVALTALVLTSVLRSLDAVAATALAAGAAYFILAGLGDSSASKASASVVSSSARCEEISKLDRLILANRAREEAQMPKWNFGKAQTMFVEFQQKFAHENFGKMTCGDVWAAFARSPRLDESPPSSHQGSAPYDWQDDKAFQRYLSRKYGSNFDVYHGSSDDYKEFILSFGR